jgi:ubiquinone biosynthesis protein COQ4
LENASAAKLFWTFCTGAVTKNRQQGSSLPSNSASHGDLDCSRFPADRFNPLATVLAAVRLIRNTQDTRQVALLEIAAGGYSRKHLFQRFVKSATGRAVIQERRSLIKTLDDHEYLRTLPENSLGRHYLAHMQREGLSVQGLYDATPAVNAHIAEKPEAVQIFLNYSIRCSHDLHHVLVGYGRDELGEACVVAMAYQHVEVRGYKIIFTFAPPPIRKQLRRLKVDPRGVAAEINEAKRIGREAAWLPGLDIESALGEDIDALRSRLNIQKPELYNAIIARVRASCGWQSGPWVHFPAPEVGIAATAAIPG